MTGRFLALFIALAAIFLLFPGIDLWFSGLFLDGQRFPLVGSGAVEGVRNGFWSASILTLLTALGLWFAGLTLGRKAKVPARLWGWVVALYVLGPGLLVNGILKEYWGRARPAQVFTGDAEFSPPFVISDQCARNCSFVSGETSAAVTLAIVIGVLLWPFLGRLGRRYMVVALSLMATSAGLLRIATGRHFLSDVIFAGFLVAFVALALWRLMNVAPARDRLSADALRADLRALGASIRRFWRSFLR